MVEPQFMAWVAWLRPAKASGPWQAIAHSNDEQLLQQHLTELLEKRGRRRDSGVVLPKGVEPYGRTARS